MRGRLVYPVKRVLRRLMSWYVGPFAAEQRAFNEALLHFADELSARNDELRVALTRETDARLSAEAELGAGLYARLEQEAAVRESTTAQLEGALDERRRLLAEIEERLLRMERRRADTAPATVAAQPGADAIPDYFAFESRMRGSTRTRSARARGSTSRTSARRDRSSISAVDAVSSWRCSRRQALLRAGSMPTRTWSPTPAARGSTSSRAMRSRRSRRSKTDRSEACSPRSCWSTSRRRRWSALLELAAAKLRPGGVFVAETINPLSPLALRNYFADLTHAQPLVPETLELLARQAGFAEVEKRFLNEPEERLTVPRRPGAGTQRDAAERAPLRPARLRDRRAPMRIAVCSAQVPFARGGTEVFVDDLVAELRKRDHEAELVTVPYKWYPGTRVLTQAFVWRLST